MVQIDFIQNRASHFNQSFMEEYIYLLQSKNRPLQESCDKQYYTISLTDISSTDISPLNGLHHNNK